MKRTKNISYRVTPNEHEELNRYSKDFGGQKVDAILDAIRNRSRSTSSTIGSAASIVTEIEDLRKVNKKLKAQLSEIYSHSVVDAAMSDGLFIYDDEGNLVDSVYSVQELLDFVKYKMIE